MRRLGVATHAEVALQERIGVAQGAVDERVQAVLQGHGDAGAVGGEPTAGLALRQTDQVRHGGIEVD